jgi:hypothetical protein
MVRIGLEQANWFIGIAHNPCGGLTHDGCRERVISNGHVTHGDAVARGVLRAAVDVGEFGEGEHSNASLGEVVLAMVAGGDVM